MVVVLVIMTLSALSLTVLTEPGILPRAHEPGFQFVASMASDTIFISVSVGKTMPLILSVAVKGRAVNMRYCGVCFSFFPWPTAGKTFF